MELRHLRYFLAVAEERNFTRAARRLNIAQPPLTQQIKALEKEIGASLFDRSAYRIGLTEAGKVFAVEAARILGDVRNAVILATRVARGAVGHVRVGFTESASFNSHVPATFRTFRSQYPEVKVAMEEGQSTQLAEAVREGRIDVAFLRPPLANEEGLSVQILAEESMVVALPSGHHLAGCSEVEVVELAQEDFILYPRTVRPGLADAVVAVCEQAGFTPRVVQYAPQLSSTINLVAASVGISVVPASMCGLQPHMVVYVPLAGEPLKARLGIAHRAGESAPAVLAFLETARRQA